MKKRKIGETVFCIVFGAAYAFLACSYPLFSSLPRPLTSVLSAAGVLLASLILNVIPILVTVKTPTRRLKACRHGTVCLKSFVLALGFSLCFYVGFCIKLLPDNWQALLFGSLFCFGIMCILFWNGMIAVYCASVQLGVKGRVKGLLTGLVPIANIVMLFKIISAVDKEVNFETAKIRLDEERKEQQICKTKYPILFVHGVFFRDFKNVNYWGRIPEAVIKNGAEVYYGNHQSAASVVSAGQELAGRIQRITEETGCTKVNIIAHSKGGLDCRYAIAKCGAADKVASLTTINTPHRGCLFAEYLLNKLPKSMQLSTAAVYNRVMRRLGDPNPDFLAAVSDLRADSCRELDSTLTVPGCIYTQSVGSLLAHATGGKFPLNFSYHLVKHFDGANDGLVSETAFSFGENYTLLKPTGERGISHGDMIDLNRENIEGFDVREFYVQLICGLRKRGL